MRASVLLMAMLIVWAAMHGRALADNRADFSSVVSAEEIALADQCFELVRHRDFATLREKLDPELQSTDLTAALGPVAAAIPAGEPKDSGIYRANVTTTTTTITNGPTTTTRTTVLTSEYLFASLWVIQEIVLVNRGGGIVVTSLTVETSPEPLEARNALSWQTASDKPMATLLIAAAAIVVPVFILISAFFCIRTPVPRRKWLWIIFILLGVTTLSVDWIDGTTHFKLLTITLLGTGAAKAGTYGGWLFSMSFPLGAVIFWVKRFEWIAQHEQRVRQIELELDKEVF